LKVAILGEFSGVIRDAFIRLGHDAISCDLLPTESPGPHIEGDCFDEDWSGMDLLICHPVCTFLANSSARWLYEKEGRWEKMVEGAKCFKRFLELPVKRIAAENPVMHGHAVSIIGQRASGSYQPWHHGHKEIKRSCLWLKGLPMLEPSNVVGPPPKDPEERKKWAKVHRASPGPDRWKERSRTLRGVADAMAHQWGSFIAQEEVGPYGWTPPPGGLVVTGITEGVIYDC
jgi:hypothetical protein